jgi:uncharacterized membrane-anchored protein YhcB (DUF1043 family)
VDPAEENTEGEAEEPEAWMAEDEQASTAETDQPKLFTGADIKGARLKERAKTEKRYERDIEDLKSRLAKYESGASPAAQTPSSPIPTLEQFGYDETQYAQAMQKWVSGTVQNQMQTVQQSEQQKQQLQRFQQDVDAHYERAAQLAQKHGIKPEVYQQTDLDVRSAVESIRPNQGDAIIDGLIAQLGEGSEKVMYHLGRNPAKLAEFKNQLASDPSGLKAAVYLGQLKGAALSPPKKASNAPKPPTQITGDSSRSPSGSALQKKYLAADKKGDHQAAYNARKAAKAQGIDVSNW